LKAHAWPKLKVSLSEEDGLPLDLSEAFLNSMESLMLAQAQECVWQWAVMGTITRLVLIRRFLASSPGRNSNGTIAKLATQVNYYVPV
jgi:programmed cell death 6-interacting protein